MRRRNRSDPPELSVDELRVLIAERERDSHICFVTAGVLGMWESRKRFGHDEPDDDTLLTLLQQHVRQANVLCGVAGAMDLALKELERER